MNMIYMLIGFSILLALIFLLAFFWAIRSGQNDDLYTPAVRILFEDVQQEPSFKRPEQEEQEPPFNGPEQDKQQPAIKEKNSKSDEDHVPG